MAYWVTIPGAIALSKDDINDGILTADELFDLENQLKAQLVVLSACGTGRGDITGDGVIGLSRSLMSAGVPSILVSLWLKPSLQGSLRCYYISFHKADFSATRSIS